MIVNKRRGLAIIYDPNSLRQFIWYYTTVSKDTDWDALCFPYGDNKIPMKEYCEKAGIFIKLFSGETDYLNLPIIKKIRLFFKLFGYYLCKKQRVIATRIINEYVGNVSTYNSFVSNGDIGFIAGLTAQFGTDKEVVYLEDGAWDYRIRNKWRCTYKFFSIPYLQGLIMARMGYCSKGRFYFEPTKNCVKYCTSKTKMKYNNYKELKEFSLVNTNMEKYNEIMEKVYPDIADYNFSDIDIVVFTEPFEDFTINPNKYIKKFEGYISKNSRKILIKKHPRDTHNYFFGEECNILEIKKEIPAEVILPFVRGKKIVFVMACSIMLSITDKDYDINILFFDDLSKGKDNAVTRKYYKSVESLKKEIIDINCEDIKIIHL